MRDAGLDVVTFLPAGAPWQKEGREVSAAGHRWEMTEHAIAGVDYFEADDREVRRKGWTYTADTLAGYPGDEEIVLVLGSDAAAGLGTWHRHEEVLARAEIAVMARPGIGRAAVEAAAGPDVIWLDAPLLELSGTTIRHRVATGKSARFLVREDVWRYIVDNDLYRVR